MSTRVKMFIAFIVFSLGITVLLVSLSNRNSSNNKVAVNNNSTSETLKLIDNQNSTVEEKKYSNCVYADSVSLSEHNNASGESKLTISKADTLTSKVILGKSKDSFISFLITFKNDTSSNQTFLGVDTSNINSNINYQIEGLAVNDMILAGEQRDVTLKIFYTGDDISNRSYDNYFRFRFEDIARVVLHTNGTNNKEKSYTVRTGSKFNSVPSATRTGYDFLGWYMADDSMLTTDTVIDTNRDYYARWEAHKHTISFDSNGGSQVNSIVKSYGEAMGELPVSSLDGYSFLGWFTSKDGGKLLVNDSIVTGDATYFAHWELNIFLVQFDSMGGNDFGNRNVRKGDSVGTLSIPVREGYEFLGWFTDPTNGEQISESTVVNGHVVYYAHWKVKNGWEGNKYYQNGVLAKGSVKVDKDYYYFDKDNNYVTGFKDLKKGYTVYYDEKGKLVMGEKKIGNYWYFFDLKNGAMVKNDWRVVNGYWHYYRNDGHRVHGQEKIGKYWYYLAEGTGNMITGFKEIKSQNKIVYYNSSGHMVYGQEKIDGEWYFFNEKSGALLRNSWKWISAQNKLVYYKGDGKMVYGTYNLNGVNYNFNTKSGAVQPKEWSSGFNSKETNAIVSAHRYDFNVDNFSTIMKNYGGYDKYVNSLGGIFTKYGNKERVKISTVAEFQEIADYVWGIMTMYGFDYSNGSLSNTGYFGKDNHSADAFYKDSRLPDYTINNTFDYGKLPADKIFAGGGGGMTTNCSCGITWALKKAGLIDQDAPTIESEFYSDDNTYFRSRGASFFKDQHNIKVGDVIGFYRDSGYFHVAVVVRVTKDSYTCYDSGHYFTDGRVHYWTASIDENPVEGYGHGAWYQIMRLPFNLK